MKVEITHDILARKIYDRIGAEDKMRLKIKEFIYDRYTYFQEANVLLTSKDLNYISPYLEKISIEEEQEAFIKKSQQEAQKRERRRRLSVLSAITVLTLISILSFIFWQQARSSNNKFKAVRGTAVKIMLNESETNIYHLKYDSAWKKIQVADSLGLESDEDKRIAFKQVIEMAYFYNESGQLENAKQRIYFICDKIPDPTFQNIFSNVEDLRDFREELERLNDYLNTLNLADRNLTKVLYRRTYPNLIPVKGRQLPPTDSVFPSKYVPDFEISESEVTVWQYAIYCWASGLGQEGINRTTPGWGLEQDNPVTNISWIEAVRFSNWMTERQYRLKIIREKIGQVYTFDQRGETLLSTQRDIKGAYRLPRSEEWASATLEILGFDSEEVHAYAWLDRHDLITPTRAHPVMKKNPNKNIYDLRGNVWEWCDDEVDPDKVVISMAHINRSDINIDLPKQPNMPIKNAVGGSFSFMDKITTNGIKQPFFGVYRIDAVGFRLVRNPE